MEDNTKFYIFDKKEIALVFAFMLLVAAVAFVLGVKFGLNYSYDSSNLTASDRQKIELLSIKEEQVNDLLEKKEVRPKDEHQTAAEMKAHSVKNLKEEFERLDEVPAQQEDLEEGNIEKSLEAPVDETPQAEAAPQVETAPVQESDPYKGKHTIRLASFRSLDDAKDFAGGFKSRGYTTIISDKNIPSKGGLWYRVSLGTFDSASEAKKYINDNQSLFATQDFRISTFD